MKRGEVYYAELGPVYGSEQGGTRPVLVVQNNKGNRYSSTTLVAAMTTRVKSPLPTHVAVKIGDVNNTILLEKLREISKARLVSHVCTLSEEQMAKVDTALKISLGLE